MTLKTAECSPSPEVDCTECSTRAPGDQMNYWPSGAVLCRACQASHRAVTRAADDDADHVASDFTGVHLDRLAALARQHSLYADPVPCGCCGPQLCCCTCHQEDQ